MKNYQFLKGLLCIGLCVSQAFGAQYSITLPAVPQSGDTITLIVPGATQPPVVTPPVAEPVAKSPIGVNLDRPWESGRDNYFPDLFKLSRFTSGALGADGWPLGNWNVRAISNWEAANAGTGVRYPKDTGDYVFTAKGQGEVYCSGASVVSQSYVNGVTMATIRRTDSTQDMDVGMRNCIGPVRDIRIWRPGYANSTQTFTNEIKAIVSTGVAFRGMNSMETNVDSDLLAARAAVVGADGKLDWADRPKLTDPNWTSPFGLPVELMIQLAKETGASPYINISNYASADYYTNLAKLCKAEIPGIPVYLAPSNETWQRGRKDFYQGPQIEAEAKAYTGTPSLQDPAYGPANAWYASQRYTLVLAYKISDAFRSVYGNTEMGKTVRVLFECQSGQPALAADTLAWAWKVYPKPPKYYLWGLMSAPYYGASVSDTATKQQIIDGVFAGQSKKIAWDEVLPQENPRRYHNPEAQYYSIAQAHELAWGCYEAGLDLRGPNRANNIAVSYDAQAKDFTTANVAVCMAQGCQLYMYYKATSAYGAYTYGATDDATLLTNPRFAGLAQAAQTDPRRWEISAIDKAAGYFGVAPSTAVLGNGTGLKATYSYTENGTPKTFTRVDKLLNFWYQGYDTGGPFPRADILDNAHKSWSCVWEGKFVPEYTGAHTFSFDGKWGSLGVLINGQAITTINLAAGVPVPIKVTFSSMSGEGKLRAWVTTDGRKRIIKTSQLIPN